MKTIAVLGAGTMGRGIAHVFAQKGFRVHWVEVSQAALTSGRATLSHNLDRMLAKGRITQAEKTATLGRITPFTHNQLSKATTPADVVVEAITERLDSKRTLFRELDEICKPAAILATNTSSISITQLATATRRPQQVIGMHFMNPVPVMPLVEVIRGYNTSATVAQTIIALAKTLDKTPVEVNDYPGFVANRILMPMINEAIETLYQGVAGVEQLDTVMRLGMAHPMGPLQLADFIGLDVCLAILNVMYEGFKNPKYAPCPLLVNMVNAGKLGIKSGEGFYDYTQSQKAERVAQHFKNRYGAY